MLRKKNIFIFICGLLLVFSTFFISYNISANYLNNSQSKDEEKNTYNQLSSADMINDNAKIVLRTKNSTNGKVEEVGKLTVFELKEKLGNKIQKSTLEDFYAKEGYKLYSFDKNEIIFIKESSGNFEANKYYLGVENGFIAIFKSDNDGKLIIEDRVNDVTKKSIESLPEGDRRILRNYELKFNTKEEAEEQLTEFQS
ncbi:hypothetical protein [Desnuesiella massiliensis]|uniref:hypothetical protein n=1 Tax=Desnuesiella massiliensis TaxID=1650662 RepID=UPI0006E29633|nr:hypothetical protein [Desnuesiella massiliensis]